MFFWPPLLSNAWSSVSSNVSIVRIVSWRRTRSVTFVAARVVTSFAWSTATLVDWLFERLYETSALALISTDPYLAETDTPALALVSSFITFSVSVLSSNRSVVSNSDVVSVVFSVSVTSVRSIVNVCFVALSRLSPRRIFSMFAISPSSYRLICCLTTNKSPTPTGFGRSVLNGKIEGGRRSVFDSAAVTAFDSSKDLSWLPTRSIRFMIRATSAKSKIE